MYLPLPFLDGKKIDGFGDIWRPFDLLALSPNLAFCITSSSSFGEFTWAAFD